MLWNYNPALADQHNIIKIMGFIPDYIAKEIIDKAELLTVVNQFVPMSDRGASRTGDCPKCGGKKKLNVTPAKDIWKCFACGDKGGKGAVSFLMKYQNMDYPTALKWLADFYNIQIPEAEVKQTKPKKVQPLEPIPHTAQRRAPKAAVKSFRDKQLEASGLSNEDQQMEIITGADTRTVIDRYTPGTLNEMYMVAPGDDMVMRYVTLDRKLVTYMPKNGKKERDFFRMRWQNPALHMDRNGSPMKYQSPAGSGSKLWFPCKFISLYESGAVMETIAIHEGEKKADKAQKHGLNSIGIMGIHNLAQNNRLPHEIEMIVKRGVKNVLFVVDADFRDLGKSLEKSADARPRTFMQAVYNFQQYFFAFNNLGIHLNIYFAYIRKNAANEKGFDDLLGGSMAGKEDAVIRNIYATMNTKSGEGEFLDVHNITSWPYHKFMEFFHVQNVQAFGKYYEKELRSREVFRFGRELWKFGKNDSGETEVQLAQPIGENEKFWDEKVVRRNGGGEEEILRFNYHRCYGFLSKRGFGRFKTFEGKNIYVRTEQNIVSEVQREEVKSYVTEFSEQLNKEALLNLLYAGGARYFSEDSLQNIKFIEPHFLESQKGVQYMFFQNCSWKITADGVTESPLSDIEGHVWNKQITEQSARKLDEMLTLEWVPTDDQKEHIRVLGDKYVPDYAKGTFNISAVSPEGEKCHFLHYLVNASNFWKQKTLAGEQMSADELQENLRHFLQKCTAFGYLLHTHFDSRVTKAVIAMDGKLSEVGSSEGRSGKSLLGRALERLLPTVYIPGKQKDLTEDRFLLEEVQPGRTKILWIDDVRVNFDFEFFFPFITGGAKFETKGIRRTTLPPSQTPKLYICTNHAINEAGGSFSSRMIKLAFSDWYFDDGNGNSHSPLDDFGVSFFDEWDFDQWNRFFNFSAWCLQQYFKYGIIPAPNDRLEMRRLRQFIGELFLDWADEYFANAINRNHEIPRAEISDKFYEKHPEQRRVTDPRRLKQKLIAWCKFRFYIFNPGYPSKESATWGGDLKKGGVEYFLIADEQWMSGKQETIIETLNPTLDLQ